MASNRHLRLKREAPEAIMRTVPLVLGLDLGTSRAKGALYDLRGNPFEAIASAGAPGAGSCSASYPTSTSPGGAAEQDPEQWWQVTRSVIGSLASVASVAGGRVCAIGLSSQIGNQVMIGSDGSLLAPSPIWSDTRAWPEVDRLYGCFSQAELDELLGMHLPPGPNWPAARLAWFRRSFPAIADRTRMVLQVKDFLGWRLTGELATDASSWRGLVCQPSGEIPAELLGFAGFSADQIPSRLDPWARLGEVIDSEAEALGLDGGIPVAVGWNDLNCGVLGMGIGTGAVFDLTGTSDHLGCLVREPIRPETTLLDGPYLPGTRLLYGVTAASGGCLSWISRVLTMESATPGDPERVSHTNTYPYPGAGGEATLVALAGGVPPGAAGLMFLPYLAGERTPLWDPLARGAFLGLSLHHGPAEMTRAVLEGVAYSLATILHILERSHPLGSEQVHAAGGGTRSAVWNSLKADVLGVPYAVAGTPEVGCLGAAKLAIRMLGLPWEDIAPPFEVLEPDREHHEIYEDLLGLFANAWPSVSTVIHSLGALQRRAGGWGNREDIDWSPA